MSVQKLAASVLLVAGVMDGASELALAALSVLSAWEAVEGVEGERVVVGIERLEERLPS